MHVRSCQVLEFLGFIVFVSQMTPPFAPPKGMSASEHFHVIHAESAFTVSSSPPDEIVFPPCTALLRCCNDAESGKCLRGSVSHFHRYVKSGSHRLPEYRMSLSVKAHYSCSSSNWLCAILNGFSSSTMSSPACVSEEHYPRQYLNNVTLFGGMELQKRRALKYFCSFLGCCCLADETADWEHGIM